MKPARYLLSRFRLRIPTVPETPSWEPAFPLVLAGGLEELTAEKLTEILNFANYAAALTCTRPGAIPAMPP